MIYPMGNRIFVKLDESIPTSVEGLIIPPDVNRWRSHRENQIDSMNRGKVMFIGPDVYGVEPGDYIRFSEINYPTTEIDGSKYVIITDMDVVGVEEEGTYGEANAA